LHATDDIGFAGGPETLPSDNDGARMALADLYCSEPTADPLNAGEPNVIRLPAPRREMDPPMTGDRQPKVDRPLKI
jgi:hypothetical protein